MTFLLTNDDGYFSASLTETLRGLREEAEILVLVPSSGRSASSMALTIHKPLRVDDVMRDGERVRICNGTPVDCVLLAIALARPEVLEGVVSGINDGPNLGLDIHYSGTVAAARKAALNGLQGVAISMGELGLPGVRIHLDTAYRLLPTVARLLRSDPMPPGVFVNLNIPNLLAEQITGVEGTRPGRRRYRDLMEARVDPTGRHYYWTNGVSIEPDDTPGTDAFAVACGRISLTPLSVDLDHPIPDWSPQAWVEGLAEIYAKEAM
ncbi:5'/3'-nucleotidase SurE [bacterium]|nr:5'/3'-nucleotidase SurE [bacterium]